MFSEFLPVSMGIIERILISRQEGLKHVLMMKRILGLEKTNILDHHSFLSPSLIIYDRRLMNKFSEVVIGSVTLVSLFLSITTVRVHREQGCLV